jgi:hypothetical protein
MLARGLGARQGYGDHVRGTWDCGGVEWQRINVSKESDIKTKG